MEINNHYNFKNQLKIDTPQQDQCPYILRIITTTSTGLVQANLLSEQKCHFLTEKA